MLVLSADVAGGHDAACRGIAESILRAHPGAEVEIVNGLAWCGRIIHWIIRDGYRLQITRVSASSYGGIYWFISTAFGRRFTARFLLLCGGAGLVRQVRSRKPDIVISCYPLLTMLIARARRHGRLDALTAAVITDVAPNDIYFARGIDSHYVCTESDAEDARIDQPRVRVEAIRPPIDLAFADERCQRAARERLGLPVEGQLVVVTGGSWAVGGMRELVTALVAGTTATIVVACGSNQRLRERLQRDFRIGTPEAAPVIALDYCDDMPSLMAAADVVAHTAAGMTAFEAFAAARPVVISHPLGGHGARSAAALDRDGLAQLAESDEAFVAGVRDALEQAAPSRARVARARALDSLPEVGARALDMQVVPQPLLRRASMRAGRIVAHAAVAVSLLVTFNVARPDSDQAQAHGHVPVTERIELSGCDAPPGHHRRHWPSRAAHWAVRKC